MHKDSKKNAAHNHTSPWTSQSTDIMQTCCVAEYPAENTMRRQQCFAAHTSPKQRQQHRFVVVGGQLPINDNICAFPQRTNPARKLASWPRLPHRVCHRIVHFNCSFKPYLVLFSNRFYIFLQKEFPNQWTSSVETQFNSINLWLF